MTVPIPIRSQGPRPGGLASVAGEMPVGVIDWRRGIEWTPVCGATPFVWNCTSDQRVSPNDVKPLSPMLDGVVFHPTHVGVETECGPNSRNTPVGDTLIQAATIGLERTRWARVAQMLHDGDNGDAASANFNPSLQSLGTVPAGHDVLNPADFDNTLQGMLDDACNCWGDTVILHVPQQYLPHFVHQQIVEWRDGGYWHGHIPVSFDCYPNLGPLGLPPGDEIPAADGSEVWMYLSGEVLVGWGALEEIVAFDPQQNRRVVEVVRPAIVAFDPCCVIGAKAVVC